MFGVAQGASSTKRGARVIVVRVRSFELAVFVVSTLVCASPLACRADHLGWLAPPDCTSRVAAQEEIERLVGRPLGDSQTADFNVVVWRDNEQRVLVALSVRRSNGENSTRELTGGSCEEAQDMAAVAIAMAISGDDPGSEDIAVPVSAPTVDDPPGEGPRTSAPPAAASRAVPWRLSLGAKLAVDYGALPGLALGAEGDISVNHGHLRIEGLGGYFGRRKAQEPDGRGGEFSLFLGGLLGCFQHELGRIALVGCAGGELGMIKAEGFGLRNPRLKSGPWRALRAQVGMGWEFSPDVRLTARLGVTVPLVRQQFVVDGATEVHQSEVATLRGLVGVEFWP